MKHAIKQFGSRVLSLFTRPFKYNGGVILIIILTFILGFELGHKDYSVKLQNYQPVVNISTPNLADQNVNLDFKLFWYTWNLIHQKYIDKSALDPQKLYYGAIQGMVAAIGDPYTVFLPPKAQQATKEQLSGSFDGIGMELGFDKDKHLAVIAPLKDTPADKAGVKSGDLILKIDSKDTTNLSLPDAVNLIRGPKGSSVNLQLFTEGDAKPRDIKVVRDTIVIKSVTYQKKVSPTGKNVAYFQISTFGDKTEAEWDDAVSSALADGDSEVVVDVRNNPGGYLEAAIYIASEFIKEGTVVISEDYNGNKDEKQVVRAGKLTNLPLVVLINKGSASASEILSGAIQDHQRGKLVGGQSFGKGTIQSAEDLPEGTGIHITTDKWLTPNGRWVHGVGLAPDVQVEQNSSDPTKDVQLEKALEVVDRE